MDSIFESLTGVTSIVDDVLVYGRTKQEHDQNLRQVLERARNKGVRFNPDKMKIGVTEEPFFGNRITSSGLQPDPNKIRAIMEIKPPDNRTSAKTYSGSRTVCRDFHPIWRT